MHGEAQLAEGGSISDLDLAVDERPGGLLRRALPDLHHVGLHTIALWPYDVADTLTAFLSDRDAGRGVQIDLLSDPEGQGKYGVRSSAVFHKTTLGRSWPTVSATCELLYSLRKRQVKGQVDRVEDLVAQAQRLPRFELESVAGEIFSARVQRRVLRLIDVFPQWVEPGAPPAYRRRRAVQLLRRLHLPVGYWVEIIGLDDAAALAKALADRFGKFLPHSGVSARPDRLDKGASWFMRQVASVRWRPGLFVSWTERRPGWLPPDLTIEPEHLNDASERIVTAMEERLSL